MNAMKLLLNRNADPVVKKLMDDRDRKLESMDRRLGEIEKQTQELGKEMVGIFAANKELAGEFWKELETRLIELKLVPENYHEQTKDPLTMTHAIQISDDETEIYLKELTTKDRIAAVQFTKDTFGTIAEIAQKSGMSAMETIAHFANEEKH